MAKILITPIINTVRMIHGTTFVGGDRYLVIDRHDTTVRNLLTLEIVTSLEGVEVDDKVTQKEFDELVEELRKSTPRKEGETASEYNTNLAIFAAEALNSEVPEDEKQTVAAATKKPRGKAQTQESTEPKTETE